MKILTLNTHSLLEENYEEKLKIFCDAILEIKPDIIALQEVNQTMNKENPLEMTDDNHSKRVYEYLVNYGVSYNYEYLPIKNAYKNYVEGMSIFSIKPIAERENILLSKTKEFTDWKKRMALGIKTIDGVWFYSCHFGWWNDENEPFISQWKNLQDAIEDKETVFIMGDFNSEADIEGEGYDSVILSGFYDTYSLSKEKDEGFTAEGEILGWEGNKKKKRIDYIFTNKLLNIEKSEVIFNGKNINRVSDQFGILVTVKGGI